MAGNIGKPITHYVLDVTEADLLILEVSSFQLETTVLFAPHISAILNLTPDHLNRYAGMDDYVAAKYRIVANQTRDDYTILNADDPLVAVTASRTRAEVIYFSARQKLDSGVWLEDNEIVATIAGQKTAILNTEKLKLPGRHNLRNAMAAVAVSLAYGADPESIREELQSFTGIENALEHIAEIGGVKFVNDTKSTNVSSLKAALESVEGQIVLIMGGQDKGNNYEPVKRLIDEKVTHLVLIGESKDRIKDNMSSIVETHQAETMDDAVRMAYSLANVEETVLLSPACASFDMFTDYIQRGKAFRDAVESIAEKERRTK